MKIIILSKEKDLFFLEQTFTKPSILFRFFGNQLKKKKSKFMVITLCVIKSQILLKLVEFFRHKYLECKEGSPYYLVNGSFNDDWESSSESYSEQWFKNFIKVNISSLIDLLVSSYILGIDEITDLSLYGIAVFFIGRIKKKCLMSKNRIK
jgi:hypothetical protein